MVLLRWVILDCYHCLNKAMFDLQGDHNWLLWIDMHKREMSYLLFLMHDFAVVELVMMLIVCALKTFFSCL